jgi:hypothetical protein
MAQTKRGSPILFRLLGAGICVLAVILLQLGLIKVSENGRILGDILQNIFILCITLFLIFPETKRLQNSIIIGIFTTVLDFVEETAAVYFNWWYPKGGTQMPPFLVIPLEMVLGFFFFGTAIAIIFTVPQKVQELEINTAHPTLKDKIYKVLQRLITPKTGIVWLVAFIFLSAVIGTNGDYHAGSEAWQAGTDWQPVYTFFVWFFSGISMLGVFYLLEHLRGMNQLKKRPTEP